MITAVGSPAIEGYSVSFKASDNNVFHKGNKLSDLDFFIVNSEEPERKSFIVFNEIRYPIVWDRSPYALENKFARINELVVERNYRFALKRTYFLLRDLFVPEARKSGVNGHLLVRGFLQLSSILECQSKPEEAFEYTVLANEVDPCNIDTNLKLATLQSLKGEWIEEIMSAEQAVLSDPTSIKARKHLVGAYSNVELYELANYHFLAQRALEYFQKNPYRASSYVGLVTVLFSLSDYPTAFKVLRDGMDILEPKERKKLEGFISRGLGWNRQTPQMMSA